MKIRSVVLAILLCLLALAVGFAQNPNLGTWKLNEAKSNIPAGVGKNTTVIYTAASGDMIKVTTDGVDASGKAAHSDWTGKFDAKPYPVTGTPDEDYRAYKTKGEETLLLANMKGDKTVSNARIKIAKDGKTRTVAMTYFAGKKIHAKYVYDKQ